MRVLSLFDVTGVMVRPWVEAGVECTIVDLQHPEYSSGNPHKIRANIFEWIPDHYYDVVFAFPPCTLLCRPAARWWPRYGGKEAAVAEGMRLVNRTREIIEQIGPRFWLIENPTGQIPHHWRKYDDKFHPGEFGGWLNPPGDAYTKETCLWFSPNFPKLERRPAPEPWSKKQILNARGEGAKRANERSATPAGFSYAVFHALYPLLAETVGHAPSKGYYEPHKKQRWSQPSLFSY